MACIIPLRGDTHAEVEQLLPWYATGELDADERLRVERHLESCALCRTELTRERRLEAEVADLPLGVERGWAEMRRRIAAPATPVAARRLVPPEIGQVWRTMGRVGRSGWLVAAQVALLLITGAALVTYRPDAAYHALGNAPVARPGNVIVLFRPDVSERTLRHTLNASGARVVDGPTAADAYVLAVPNAQLQVSLARMRADPAVVMAQPIDIGAAR